MMLHNPTRRVATLVLATALAVVIFPGVVGAHADLVSSVPADKATIPSPFTGPIVLTFSEHLATGSKADLIGANGATVAAATVDATAKTMTFELTMPLAPGAYEVRWVSIADDGDLLRLPVVTFTVAAASSPSPTTVATTALSAAPTTAAVSAAPSTAPTPAPSAVGTTTGSTSDVLLPIIVAMVILVAGATYLLSRRGRPTDRT